LPGHRSPSPALATAPPATLAVPGTYDVNVLVTGRGATGIAAFKAPNARKAAAAARGAQA
jgi:hypothetical protein